jgi:hypothetical protein
MANPRLPAGDSDVRFQVYVKVTPAGGEEFKVRFDFTGIPRQGIDIYCSRSLSRADRQARKSCHRLRRRHCHHLQGAVGAKP